MTRRDWLGASGLLLAACGRKRATGYAGAFLVALAGEPELAVVDLLQFRLRDRIPLGAPASAVLHNTSASLTYALTPATGSVHLIAGARTLSSSRKLAAGLSEIHLGPAGEMLVLSPQSREIIVADPRALTPLRRLPLRATPAGMDVSKSGDIAVSLGSARSVTLFPAAGGPQRSAAIAGDCGQVRFRNDGKLLLVTRPADRVLTALSVPDLHVLADLPLAMEPSHLCFTADGGQLFVTGPGMDGLAIVFPYNTLEVEQTILVGHTPGCMACVSDPPYLFTANSTGSAVSIIDIPTRKLVGVLAVGSRPDFIAITPDSQYALILDQDSGDLAVVRIPSIRVDRKERNGAALFTLLTVGASPVQAAIVPYG